jgi:hypothetical protein
MSAVRMVAYGVLELKPAQVGDMQGLFLQHQSSPSSEELDRVNAEYAEREELRKLVNDELRGYGLLLRRLVVPRANKWRTKANAHVLYGQLTGRRGWETREELCIGDFKECCVVAAAILDKLDASQIPDTAAGNDQQ